MVLSIDLALSHLSSFVGMHAKTLHLTLFNSVVATLRPIQNKTGGFGGGHGQFSHLATTYASVLSLVMVGGDEALELVDRRAM